MPSDYAAITRDNIRRRGEEFDDIGEFLSKQFYSDKAHFVYELLQNAEDALARRAKSSLATTSRSQCRSGFFPIALSSVTTVSFLTRKMSGESPTFSKGRSVMKWIKSGSSVLGSNRCMPLLPTRRSTQVMSISASSATSDHALSNQRTSVTVKHSSSYPLIAAMFLLTPLES
ncbi:MAG: hypothetical protein COZ05_21660 [Armatimonadetes bacterium CG_4_10_14_3_um_filter_59_10]|nr:MAG: hypothetical protein COZ05_21660 [Armatimonadetes bacterium CG_4_10_14_3_um_filter_59_10]